MTMQAKVLTVSDGVVAGTRDDASGDALVEALEAAGYEVVDRQVVSDGVDRVADGLRELSRKFPGLVVTTGGTGFGPRDLTPEGTAAVVERMAPGIAEAIRVASNSDGRAFGMLTRGIAGMRGETLIVNLPGSPSGAKESLATVLPALAHALELLAGEQPH